MKKNYIYLVLVLVVLILALVTVFVLSVTKIDDNNETATAEMPVAETISSSTFTTQSEVLDADTEVDNEKLKSEAELKEVPEVEEKLKEETKVNSEPEEEEPDQFEMYEVSEDWVATHNNRSCILERDGKLYGVNTVLPGYIVEKYNIGWQYGMPSSDGLTGLWMSDGKVDAPTNASGTLTSAGDFPVFQVKRGEQLRIYAIDEIPTELELTSANFYGYTIMATQVNFFAPMDEHTHVSGTFASKIGISNVEITDLGGNPVEDVRNLEYGQEYIYSWFEGTQYGEKRMLANSKTFVLNFSDEISLPLELTKNGYCVADTTGLALGFYSVNKQSMIEVVDEFHID